jgi:hypothetical protein
MRLYLSTVVLTLVWFAVVNAAFSAVTWLAAGHAHRRSARPVGRPGAQLLLALRMLPLAASLLFAVGMFLPAHWISEAREGSEYFGALLYGLALLAVGLIGGSAIRVLAAVRACRRLQRAWRDQREDARRIVDDVAMPGVSLAGIFRTTIVVGRPVRDVLTCDELEVALAHEIAHRQSWDNLKRFAIFASPDFFGYTSAARRLEQQWSGEVECQADAQAVRGDVSRATHLASALVKVARLAGAATRPPAMALWSTFYEQRLLEVRVRRLVDGTASPARPSRLLPAGLLAVATLIVCGAWLADLPRTIHFVTEGLVRVLP